MARPTLAKLGPKVPSKLINTFWHTVLATLYSGYLFGISGNGI